MSYGVCLGPLKGLLNVILPQPAFTVWDELTEFDDPHALFYFFYHGGAAGELLAQSNLTTRADALQLRLWAFVSSRHCNSV
jgi:hypothetical protein